MQKYIYVIILLVIPSCLWAGEFPQITNVYNRQTISLNGKWKYLIDQGEIGNRRKFWEDRQVDNHSQLLEYNFDTAGQINVPGDWNSQQDELLYYEGKIWYQKDFSLEKKDGKRYFIYFGAANYQTEVFLNGKKLGEHEGGFNPFNFEITDLLQDENSLVVSVDNTRKKEQIPTLVSDWKNFGGITRDVLILEENNTFIRDYTLGLKKGSMNEIEFSVWLDGHKNQQNITLEIPGLDFTETLQVNASGVATKSFIVDDISLWSPDNARLYDVNLNLQSQILTDRIGFRSIEVSGADILLNGESIYLKGISLHEESPFTHGRTHSPEEARMMIDWVKELGCNYLRLSHYPHNEHIVRLAEEEGIMLWEEIPVYWDIDWDNEKTYDLAEKMLDAMITRDKNRAAVIIWSMANETDISESRNVFLKNLIDFTRAKDNTRLISAALFIHGDGVSKNTRVIDDPFGENADIISVNQYVGWYGSALPDVIKDLEIILKFDKPLIFSEFGAGALGGFHGDPMTRWSEEFQEWYYVETLKMCDRIENLRGMSPWILADFQSPRRMLPVYQDGFNRKGLISSEGKKKKAFFVLQEYYRQK